MNLNLPHTAVAAANAVRRGVITPTQLVEHALQRIEDTRDLNAIAYVDAASALREAEALTEAAKAGDWRGPLHGVPVTVKDLYNVRGMPTKAGTRAPLPKIEPDEAVAVARWRAAGAIVVAKTNMVEIALGVHGENAWTGDVKNPHNLAHQTGGSSSGSGASMAAGVAYGSLGSDTAGSIRVPAAFCGVVGFKPTFGVVPIAGALPLCWSCDHVGPLTRTVADAALLFDVLAGRENSLPADRPITQNSPTLAVPRSYIDGAVTPEMRRAFDALVERLRAQGATIKDVKLDVGDFMAQFMPLRAESVYVHRAALESAPEGFQPSVRDALMRGYEFSALQYIESLHKQVEMRATIHKAMDGADALLLPAVHGEAPVRGTVDVMLESGSKNGRLAILHFSGPFAFAGVPALALPFAKTSEGLPLGAQVVTRYGDDPQALAVSAWIEAKVAE